jgi:hypothetical protein
MPGMNVVGNGQSGRSNGRLNEQGDEDHEDEEEDEDEDEVDGDDGNLDDHNAVHEEDGDDVREFPAGYMEDVDDRLDAEA